MAMLKEKIDSFFDAYAARVNSFLQGAEADTDGAVKAFADCFVEASPVGIICGRNDEEFKKAIPKGYAFYKSIGTKSMAIVSKNITELDEYHVMVKVNWSSVYLPENKKEIVIDFDVIYFLQCKDQSLKIFAYITGDEQKVLKEKGLPDK